MSGRGIGHKIFNRLVKPSFETSPDEETGEPLHVMREVGRLRIHEVRDSALIQSVLADHENFSLPAFVKNSLAQVIGPSGLFLLEGDAHLAARDQIKPFFNQKTVRQSFGVAMVKESREMTNRWREAGTPVDIQEEMSHLVGKTLLRSTVFHRGVTESQERTLIEAAAGADVNLDRVSPVTLAALALGRPVDHHVVRLTKPLQASMRRVHAILDDVIQERLIDKNLRPNDRPADLLEKLLDSALAKPLSETGFEAEMEQVKGSLFLYAFAGQSTTVYAMTRTIQAVLQHPQVLSKINDQVTPIMEENGGTLRPEDYGRLSYARRVAREAMRLWPPQHSTFRSTTADKGDFKKGDLIVLDFRGMQRSPQYWENPLSFNPERMPDNEKVPPHWLPFGTGGRHQCPGMNAAFVELTYAVSEVAHAFRKAGDPRNSIVQAITGENLKFVTEPVGRLIVQPPSL